MDPLSPASLPQLGINELYLARLTLYSHADLGRLVNVRIDLDSKSLTFRGFDKQAQTRPGAFLRFRIVGPTINDHAFEVRPGLLIEVSPGEK